MASVGALRPVGLRRRLPWALGGKMRRLLTSISFFVWGLFITWASLRLIARIDWSKVASPRPDGCWEIDHCNVPWYIGAWFIVALLLPTALHTVIGWRLAKVEANGASHLASVLALSVGTFIFYAGGRIASGY